MTAATSLLAVHPTRVRRGAAALISAALVGLLSLLAGPVALGVLVAAAVLAAAAHRPIYATYAYLLLLPFTAGLGRDTLIPLVRPNELLLALVLLGAAAGGYARFLRGAPVRIRLRPLDVPLIGFVLLSTVWPVESMLLRGVPPELADVMAVAPVAKLVALLVLVRCTVLSEAQLVRCMRLVLWTAAAVGLVAVLQVLGVQPVVSALTSMWASDAGSLPERGTSTLGSSIATGDYLIIGLTLLVSGAMRGLTGRREAVVLGLVLGAGVLASGQFSTWISLAVVGVVVLRRVPGIRRKAVRMLPIAAVALVVGAPALLNRLSDFGSGGGLPSSWQGRWDNLVHFYLPELADSGFLIGISPNSVLRAPETWREVIYLESGYLHFLWVGGIPLLLGFAWLSVAVLRATARLRSRGDAVGAFATTLEAAWWAVLVLSVIDIHLVVRGVGDLLFVLLAIVSARAVREHRAGHRPVPNAAVRAGRGRRPMRWRGLSSWPT
ncbi:hypothetical protein ABT324_27120 [Saccharopolyspora sp. NPDC000359]|uniref:hypothetical protein n=1 Tax=Saccharopolyspora sp. NPDC000359 TaxID=3154251 RepID=UPI0033192F38